MNAAYDTFRSALALVTAVLPDDDHSRAMVGQLLDELEATPPADVVNAFLGIVLGLVDCIARDGNADREDVWRQFSVFAISALTNHEGTS